MRKGLGFHNRRSPGNYFTPAALFPSGTAGAWYDPSDSTTLFSDTAGTTPSPTPGAGALSVVGKMLDKSGNGNHAIAYNTTTARPELSARVNLLTYSEQFDNGLWVKNSGSVSANSTTAPDGTTTADTFTSTAAAAAHNLQFSGLSAYSQSNLNHTAVVSVKAGTHNFVTLSFSSGSADAWAAVTVDLSTGTATKTGNGVNGTLVGTPTVVSQGNGWYRIILTARYASGVGTYVFIFTNSSGTPTYGSYGGETWTPAGTETVFVWGADLRPANIGASVPAYQRIADQYTYDSSGFPRYLVFNGTASGMYTPASIPFATVTSDGQARRNLLNNPTQFDVTASWTPTALTVTANAIVAPDGTTTADTITGDGTVATHWITQSQSASATGKVFSVYAKAGTNNFIQLLFAGDANPWANFDLSNGTVGSVGTSVTAAISNAGNGWYRCSASTSSAAASSVFVNLVNASTAPRGQSVALSTSAYLWGAQAESGTTLTAFQNIGTDKVTVFAGVRKTTTNTGVVAETSAIASSNNGAFLGLGTDSGGIEFFAGSRGTAYIDVFGDSASYTSPFSAVTTAAFNIAAPSAQLRVNAVVTETDVGSQGTGNYGSYPLNIGARNASSGTPSFFFPGFLYSLIVVGAASTAAQISSTESWINVKEGGVY